MTDFKLILQLKKESFFNSQFFVKRGVCFTYETDGTITKNITNYSDMNQTIKDNIDVVINVLSEASSVIIQSIDDVVSITYMFGNKYIGKLEGPALINNIKNHALAVYDSLKDIPS